MSLRANCTTKLKYLGLSQQIIEEETAQELKGFMVEAKYLKKFDLSFSKMTNFSNFIDIIEGMQENKSIQGLNLCGVSAGGSGGSTRDTYAQAITTLIENSETLVHLNLSACFPGLQVFTDVIKEKPKEQKMVMVDPTGRIIQPKKKEVEEEYCGLTSMF